MNQEQKNKCSRLTVLLGKRSWRKVGQACRGDWAGTIDYSLLFDDGSCLFISNGMKHFEDTVNHFIDCVGSVSKNHDKYLHCLQEQAIKDNEKAKTEGLKQVEVLDLLLLDSLWTVVRVRVGDKIFNHVESGLNYCVLNDELEKHIQENNERRLFTAGAVDAPDYIFLNVRFCSEDGLYKHDCDVHKTKVVKL